LESDQPVDVDGVEAKRKEQIKKLALGKLTAEEIKALGITQ